MSQLPHQYLHSVSLPCSVVLNLFQEVFGDEVLLRTFVVFTHAETVLKKRALNDYIEAQLKNTPLQCFLAKEVEGRTTAVENETEVAYIKSKQRKNIISMLGMLLKMTKYTPYTDEVFQEAQALRLKRQQKIEEKKRKKIDKSPELWSKKLVEELYSALEDKLEQALGDAELYNSDGEYFEEQKALFSKNKLSARYRDALNPLIDDLSPEAKSYFQENEQELQEIIVEYVRTKYQDFEKLTNSVKNKIKNKLKKMASSLSGKSDASVMIKSWFAKCTIL